MTVPTTTRRITDASGCETLDGRDAESVQEGPDRNEEAPSGVAPRESIDDRP
jgi:hypothetical protein